jgi:hypothetical protein
LRILGDLVTGNQGRNVPIVGEGIGMGLFGQTPC